MATWLQKLGRGIGYIVNPLSIIGDYINGKNIHDNDLNPYSQQLKDFSSSVDRSVSKVWDDLTGVSQIKMQNQLEKEVMDYKYQKDLDAIGDTADEYEAQGFNRNLLYGSANPVSYQAPNLQAYSGSSRLENILSRTGKVLSLIPAMYQATAALEGIDQARERTKQSEIKTMSMGLSLLDQGYKVGDLRLSHPFSPTLYPYRFGGKRHVKEINFTTPGLSTKMFDTPTFQMYADASLKQKMDLLASIGIKNEMNSTLNSWRGYQYQLDRRFGAAGRIVGMGTQGARALGSLFSPIKLFGK